MAIAVRASGSVTYDWTGSSSQVVTIPSGTVAGDLMVVSWGGTGTPSLAPPTGWTSVGTVLVGQWRQRVCYRLAQGGDTNWTFSESGGNTVGGIALQSFSGVDQTTPIDATGTVNSTSGPPPLVANAVTTVTNNAWELIGVQASTQGNISATNFTALNNAGANVQVCLLYNTTPLSIGSTGTVSGSYNSGSASAIPFAIRPAAATLSPYSTLKPYVRPRLAGPLVTSIYG